MANATKRSKAAKPPQNTAETLSPVTGIRIPQEILDGLDGWVSEMNRDPDRLGNATRGRLVVKILREALEARNRSKPVEGGGSP